MKAMMMCFTDIKELGETQLMPLEQRGPDLTKLVQHYFTRILDDNCVDFKTGTKLHVLEARFLHAGSIDSGNY
jgi:hypothetical protein